MPVKNSGRLWLLTYCALLGSYPGWSTGLQNSGLLWQRKNAGLSTGPRDPHGIKRGNSPRQDEMSEDEVLSRQNTNRHVQSCQNTNPLRPVSIQYPTPQFRPLFPWYGLEVWITTERLNSYSATNNRVSLWVEGVPAGDDSHLFN